MDKIHQLRDSLSGIQLEILTHLWHSCIIDDWLSTRIVHHKCGRPETLEALGKLGGSIVREVANPAEGQGKYELTFLGTLLTEEGEENEKLVVRYLRYIARRFASDPTVKRITSGEVQVDLKLNELEKTVLGKLIALSGFYSGASWGGEWSADVPKDIDTYREISARQYGHLVSDRALRDYDAMLPVLEEDRNAYYRGQARQSQGEFAFITNEYLRELLTEDWSEANSVYAVKAYKSCVILCGSIVEGMLLDVIEANEEASIEAYFSLNRGKKPLNEWGLADLVKVAESLGLLGPGSVHLGNALREFRNLVHPNRQRSRKLRMTKEEADMARAAVAICLSALSRQEP